MYVLCMYVCACTCADSLPSDVSVLKTCSKSVPERPRMLLMVAELTRDCVCIIYICMCVHQILCMRVCMYVCVCMYVAKDALHGSRIDQRLCM
jgi:hypothetical protein